MKQTAHVGTGRNNRDIYIANREIRELMLASETGPPR